MSLGTGMDVDVEEFDGIEVSRDETGLFERFTQRRRLGTLVRVDVTTGLDPHIQEQVSVQDDAPRRHDECRRRDVANLHP